MSTVHDDHLRAELTRLRTTLPADSTFLALLETVLDLRYMPIGNRVFTNAAARDAAITVPLAGMTAYLSTPKVETWYDGTAWRGEWVTSFVPTLSQGAGSPDITKTVVTSQYRYDGPMIEFESRMDCTAGVGAGGTPGDPLRCTLPVAGIAAHWANGSCFIYDASLTKYSIGTTENDGTLFFNVAEGNIWGISPTQGLANGDQVRFQVRYRWI